MSMYPDIMVDLETTGLDPSRNAILQIAAVRFNIRTGEVSPNFFDQSLAPMWGRSWDEDTREWWLKDKREILRGIIQKARPAVEVMREFQQFVTGPLCNEPVRFWSKPISFDFPFVQSYFNQTGVMNPFDFREAIDMRTWLRGKLDTMTLRDVLNFERSIEFQGPAHNAIFDTLHQVKVVLAALPKKVSE